MKGVSELSKVHREQQANIHVELRKELSNLRKKMIDGAVSILLYKLLLVY